MTAIALPACDHALPPLERGWQLVTAAALRDNSLALLAADADLAREWRRDKRGVPLGRPGVVAARATARIWRYDGDQMSLGPTFPLETPFPLVDQFTDGRWLVVAARTAGESNARVIAADGSLVARFMLGDGIKHVVIDDRDQIWVGWFDEGIFGNEAWRVPGEVHPPSSWGIGRFTAEGRYLGLPPLPASAGGVYDCYALNAFADSAWACPYGDFPLLHLQPKGRTRWWKTDMSGSAAVAVDGRRALMAGGYGADANRIVLLELEGLGDGDAARLVATGRLPLTRRTPPPGEHPEISAIHVWERPRLLAGRGDMLHLVHADLWHRWRLVDLWPER